MRMESIGSNKMPEWLGFCTSKRKKGIAVILIRVGWQIFSVKGKKADVSGFIGHVIQSLTQVPILLITLWYISSHSL